MANTVNDVMNVIASPDYGIKNIAGTNQEILAILSGTHNSKNNIHVIVNDIKLLLQKLVSVSTEKKPIEMGGDKVSKANPKNVQNILDETKNIRKSIDNLTKSIIKQSLNSSNPVVAKLIDNTSKVNPKNIQNILDETKNITKSIDNLTKSSIKGSNPVVAKLSDKASQKVANAMVKDIEKQNKNGGITALVDAFTKLKNISIKDIIFGKQKLKIITKIFKNSETDLKIKEKDLNSIIKLINAAPEMITSLSKINRKVNKIIKNDTITKLGDILVGKKSILIISKSLKKNDKLFTEATKISNDIKELLSSLKKTLRNLFFASLWSKVASFGIKSIDSTLDKILTLTKKISKNKKNIETSTKTAKKITTLVGNLLVTSIFLTIAAATGILATFGSKCLSKMIDTIIPVAEKLSKNNKKFSKAINSALILTAFTGIMAIASLALATIAVTGIPAIIGSVFMAGIVTINLITFTILSKASNTIKKGGLAMAIMGGSLLIFGIALGKISDATKNMSWEQLGMIGTLTVGFGLAIAALGVPTVALFVMIGSGVLGAMGIALYTFAKSLKIMSDLGEVPTKTLNQVLNAIKKVKDFFIENSIKRKVVKQAGRYKRMMRPFGKTIKHLAKLKNLGVIPMKLVHQTLNAMKSIADYYENNPISKDVIKASFRYLKMLKPFGSIIKKLSKLKEMGSLPKKLISQTLDAIGSIADFYQNRQIDSWME